MRRSLNNRPLRSVLANRKMFQGGGIVANGGGPRPMANMQPNGILASSPNLINSVVGDAINPQGGNTLSMAEGGIARFANGGYADMAERLRSDVAKTIAPLESYKKELVPSQTFREAPGTQEFTPLGVLSEMFFPEDRTSNRLPQAAPMGSLENEPLPDAVNRIFPLKAFPGQRDFEENFAPGEVDRSKLSRLEEGIFDVVGSLSEEDREMSANFEVWTGAVSDQLLDAAKKRATKAELRTINRMAQMRPDLASRIGEIGLSLINRKESGQDYQITEFVSSQEALEDLSNNPLAQDITAQLKQEELSNAEAFLHGSSPYQENLAEAARVRGEVEPFERAIGSMSAAEELQAGAVDAKMRAQLQTHQDIEAATTEGHKAAAKIAEAGDAGAGAGAGAKEIPLPVTKPAPDEIAAAEMAEFSPSTSVPPGQTPREVIESERVAAALDVKDAFDADTSENQKDAQTSLEAYIEKFKSTMPDYEGKSESEKGWDIVKMGMAIAAGESPNAIANISKGVMATIDNFTSDDKERRAYKRQIGLSAAKYGLQNVARDAAELRADVKAGRQLYDEVWRVRPGKTFNYGGETLAGGDRVILKVRDIQDGSVDLSNLETEDSVLAGIKAYNKAAVAAASAIEKTVVDPNKFSASSKTYIADSMRVRTNVATQGLLKNAVVALQSPDSLGVRGAYKTALLGLANSVGEKQYAMEIFDGLDTQKKFKDWVNRAVTTQIEGLINEGGKISNQERDLAREIGGALEKGFFSGVFADKETLVRRIEFFSDSLARDSDTRLRSMGLQERAWDKSYNTTETGRVSYGQMLRDTRQPVVPTGFSGGKQSGSINWRDIISVDAETNAVLGFRKDWDK